MKNVSELENAVETLETRNAFQDDIIEQLSHELSVHQNQIAELKLQLNMITKRLKENSASSQITDEIEPPPPHY